MTFIKDYYRTLVPDWRNYYINLAYLNEELLRIKKLVRDIHAQGEPAPGPDGEPPLTSKVFALRKLQKDFSFIFEGEIIKFCGFFKLSFGRTIRPKLVQLRLNVKHYRLIADARKKRKAYFSIKRALLMFYKELTLFNQYIESNLECVEALCTTYRQIFVGVDGYDPAIVAKIHVSLQQSFPVVTKPELERITKAVFNTYMDFCVKETRDERREDLQAASNASPLNSAQLVLTGVFIGIFALACCIVAFLLYELRFFSSSSSAFATFSVPIFRGTLIAFLYVLSTGVCVLVWERYNINYRRPFQIAEQHMKPYQIFKLGFGFLCIWVITFIYCGFAALEHRKHILHTFFQPAVAHWLPPCLYLCVAFYALFPSSRLCHGDMRLYIARTCASLIYFPVRRFSFKEKFFVSQLTTFKPFFRDMAYAICYAQTLFRTGKQQNACTLSTPYLYFETFLNLAPLLISTIQNLRDLVLDKKTILLRLYSIFTFVLTLLCSLSPAKFNNNPSMKLCFYVLMAVNTVCSYFDDLKFSWQLLQKNSVHPLLRDVLALPHLSFYYFAVASNLFLRFYWTVNLLPLRYFQSRVVENIVALGTVFTEVVRRTIGNIIRVEVLHWEGVGNFNVVQQLPLPFFNTLEEVARRENFESEYCQALHLGELYDNELSALQDIRPYEHLNHSFSEDELKKFAKKRTLQLIKKGQKLGKVLQQIDRKPLRQFPRNFGRRRNSIHKWNEDLSLNVSSLFALQRQQSLKTHNRGSLNKSFPAGLNEASADRDVEAGPAPTPTASRLQELAPVNRVALNSPPFQSGTD